MTDSFLSFSADNMYVKLINYVVVPVVTFGRHLQLSERVKQVQQLRRTGLRVISDYLPTEVVP